MTRTRARNPCESSFKSTVADLCCYDTKEGGEGSGSNVKNCYSALLCPRGKGLVTEANYIQGENSKDVCKRPRLVALFFSMSCCGR